jgi:hypothetical protein
MLSAMFGGKPKPAQASQEEQTSEQDKKKQKVVVKLEEPQESEEQPLQSISALLAGSASSKGDGKGGQDKGPLDKGEKKGKKKTDQGKDSGKDKGQGKGSEIIDISESGFGTGKDSAEKGNEKGKGKDIKLLMEHEFLDAATQPEGPKSNKEKIV